MLQPLAEQGRVVAAGRHTGDGEGIAGQGPPPLLPGQVEIVDRGHGEPEAEQGRQLRQQAAEGRLAGPHRRIERQHRAAPGGRQLVQPLQQGQGEAMQQHRIEGHSRRQPLAPAAVPAPRIGDAATGQPGAFKPLLQQILALQTHQVPSL